MAYDIIGDIHGYHKPLIELLEKLGYSNDQGHYQHLDRQVIFLGDFIDRGPGQKAVIDTVRAMVENDSALAVMGNHEFNALCFHTEDNESAGDFLRERSPKNIAQHEAFLEEYSHLPDELNNVLEWFKTLPMWLDMDDIRIVHACWDDKCIDYIKSNYSNDGYICENLLHLASTKGNKEFECIETILKGKEIPLPEGEIFHDKMGTPRNDIRVRWWDKDANTYQQAYMGPEDARPEITNKPIDVNHLVEYPNHEPPVFLGHYWLDDDIPKRLAKNIACTDYSIAKPGGKLVAYRWSGEKEINNRNYFYVNQASLLSDDHSP